MKESQRFPFDHKYYKDLQSTAILSSKLSEDLYLPDIDPKLAISDLNSKSVSGAHYEISKHSDISKTRDKSAIQSLKSESLNDQSSISKFKEIAKDGILSDSLIILINSMSILIIEHTPKELIETLTDLVKIVTDKHPCLLGSLNILLIGKNSIIRKEKKAEFEQNDSSMSIEIESKKHSEFCNHTDSEKYVTICKKSHCIECLREKINAIKDRSAQIRCPCDKEMSPKNKDEIMGRLKKVDVKIIKNEVENIHQKQDINKAPKSEGSFILVANKEKLNRFQNEQILQITEQKNPKIVKQMENKVNNFLEDKNNSNQLICAECNNQQDSECFSSITCTDHKICASCRIKSFDLGKTCPFHTCNRQYSDLELQLIHILKISTPDHHAQAASPKKPKKESIVFNLREQKDSEPKLKHFICVKCRKKTSNIEGRMYNCGHPIHESCKSHYGCPLCKDNIK